VQLSVVIACYNAARTIGGQLESLARQEWSEPWEVIVADNGSTDGSAAIAEQYRSRLPSLRVVDASARRGQAYARNVGAKAARGVALAFCDADDEVAPGWLAAMGAALVRYEFVACRLDVDKLNPPWARAMHPCPQSYELPPIWYFPYLPHAGGGSLGVRRELHDRIGGFAEDLPVLEDTDYCFRIQMAGVPCHFVPEAVVHYRYRHTLTKIFSQARRWAAGNVLLYKRYRPPGTKEAWRWKSFLQDWAHLMRTVRDINGRSSLATWVWQLGWQVGRVTAGIRHRIPPIGLLGGETAMFFLS